MVPAPNHRNRSSPRAHRDGPLRVQRAVPLPWRRAVHPLLERPRVRAHPAHLLVPRDVLVAALQRRHHPRVRRVHVRQALVRAAVVPRSVAVSARAGRRGPPVRRGHVLPALAAGQGVRMSVTGGELRGMTPVLRARVGRCVVPGRACAAGVPVPRADACAHRGGRPPVGWPALRRGPDR